MGCVESSSAGGTDPLETEGFSDAAVVGSLSDTTSPIETSPEVAFASPEAVPKETLCTRLRKYYKRHYVEIRPQFMPVWDRIILYVTCIVQLGHTTAMLVYFADQVHEKQMNVITELILSAISLGATLAAGIVLVRLKAHLFEKPPISIFADYMDRKVVVKSPANLERLRNDPVLNDDGTSVGFKSLVFDEDSKKGSICTSPAPPPIVDDVTNVAGPSKSVNLAIHIAPPVTAALDACSSAVPAVPIVTKSSIAISPAAFSPAVPITQKPDIPIKPAASNPVLSTSAADLVLPVDSTASDPVILVSSTDPKPNESKQI